MLKFVRALAFAELLAGLIWLWPAVFPKRITPADYVASFPRVPAEPVPVSPFPGLALIGTGTIALLSTSRHGAP